ncbi:sensor histidine kinase [Geobacter sp. AOG1]|uniref:sensor histidine kinase n=1 Tax=Geobacter sp. AOG1 TaxID=1566346 RepID=UPI001CC6A030|nr:sensor histidine kinase [Geobacter sp. AOG1]GFE57448.1 histidine kinase [Geobacter sp. AOG1]
MEFACCWTKKELAPEECPNIAEGEEELYSVYRRRVVEKCIDCPLFANDLLRFKESGHPLSEIFSIVVSEFLDQKSQLQSLGGFLTSKTREIKFLHELSLVLQTSVDLDEVLSVAMTAITAGKGFGMNRAFLLMTDKERQALCGYLGVGPRTMEEAWHIWEDVNRSNLTLRDMARLFQKNKLSSEKVKFNDILERLSVPLRDQQHVFNRALRERKPILVENAFSNPDIDPALAQLLGVDSFLIMPLISRHRRIGLILADNCITRKPITNQDLQSMETFAFPVAFALERASLYERLQVEIDKLTVANIKLKEQQELIVKMEKMALVGRITSSIAHSIRNPLMIIGGFARSLLKNMEQDDSKRDYLETIVHEAKQLEGVLEEVLSYSESLYPALDTWDINQLISGVRDELAGQLAQRGVTCVLELAPELPKVSIDYRKIAYCIKTIITSSLETITGEGEIVIRTWRDDGVVAVKISDNGTPLSPEMVETLTTPFMVTQNLGTGAGLPLCKTILEKHGSPFIIESSPEGGTQYIIRLPIKEGM